MYPALSGLDVDSITNLELHKRFRPSFIEFGVLPLTVPELLTSICCDTWLKALTVCR